jgi:uncharacterized membrane protein YphA (DoxX/SURF4 family)
VESVNRRAGWLGLVARLVVGGVWVVAGALKISDTAASVRSVRAYQLLPEAVVPTVGHALPLVEILLGTCLVLGLLTRLSGALSALMLCAFVVGISAAWARGLQIECGCFGGGSGPSADASAAYPWDIARDVALALLSLWLVWRPATPWAADNRLLPAPPRASAQPAR